MIGDRGDIKKGFWELINPHTGNTVGCQYGNEEPQWCGECIFQKTCRGKPYIYFKGD